MNGTTDGVSHSNDGGIFHRVSGPVPIGHYLTIGHRVLVGCILLFNIYHKNYYLRGEGNGRSNTTITWESITKVKK